MRDVDLEADTEKELSKATQLPKNLIISEGKKYMRLLQFDKAISSFNKVIERDSNNMESIFGRAKCYMRLAKYKEAWQDFDKVIKLKPKCIEAIYLKGVTEYLRGDFEKSFSTYWKGHKLNPSHDTLRKGYNMCDKAIKNNLDADVRMLLTERDIEKMSRLSEKKLIKPDYYKIGLFSSDLKLLDDMREDKNLNRIHSLCNDLFEYLRERQKFWKMQEPFSNTNKTSSMLCIKNNVYSSLKMNRLIRLCRTALKEGKTELCIKKSNEVLEMLAKTSPVLAEKKGMEAEALHILVMAYLIEEKSSIALKYCKQLLSSANESNMLELKGKAYQDFAAVYYVNEKYKKALQFFQESLQYVQSEEEKAVILYKISDCSIHLGNLEDAKNIAQECMEFVFKSDNKRFQFDALLLSAEIAVKGKNMKVAEEHYRKALEIALENNDRRYKDLEYLLDLFKEVATKDSYSSERFEIVQITDSMKAKIEKIN